MRLHPYYTERILDRCGPLARLVEAGSLAPHERVDGSGYHRSVSGEALSRGARILAAADAFAALTAERPHRLAYAEDEACRGLTVRRRACLDADSVACVLAAVGRRPAPSPAGWPARPHRSRGGGAAPNRAGAVESRSGGASVHCAEDGGAPRREPVPEDRGLVAGRRGPICDGAWASGLEWGVCPMRATRRGSHTRSMSEIRVNGVWPRPI